MTYWCPIAEDYTDPPRLKRSSKRIKTHILHEGKALCGKKSPAWFPPVGEKPTCPDCLSQMTQLKWWQR